MVKNTKRLLFLILIFFLPVLLACKSRDEKQNIIKNKNFESTFEKYDKNIKMRNNQYIFAELLKEIKNYSDFESFLANTKLTPYIITNEIAGETHRYYADIDGDGKIEQIDLIFGSGSGGYIDYEIFHLDESYNYNLIFATDFREFVTYRAYDPRVIEVNGFSFICEDRNGVITFYRLNNDKKELEKLEYIFGTYEGNPIKK